MESWNLSAEEKVTNKAVQDVKKLIKNKIVY